MAKDFSHLDAIQERIARETQRRDASHNAQVRAFRQMQIDQAEKELAAEYKFLGIEPVTIGELSDDELLAELNEGLDSIKSTD